MKFILKIFTGTSLFFTILALIFSTASFLIIFQGHNGLGSEIVFWGSIITTLSAMTVPLFSIKKFNLSSYKAKICSLTFGLIITVVLGLFYLNGNNVVNEIKEFASKGLIWGVNTALLLFNLAYLEIENNDAENKKIIDAKKELENQLLESERLRKKEKEEFLESQEKLFEAKKKLLEEKEKNSKI